ncbi:MAG: YitT family protein [Lachnospiraceae bacterium]|jgi:uncharacterized membrane-anchored protein YitT (DUF2179 family)|nr:YitT family protein [Lachnospiraceae bacterium]MEE3462057.1 YitT family protein [Lachnospiraceae bacterium]
MKSKTLKEECLNKSFLISMLTLIAGAIIAAFALEEFLVPNKIFDGGVTGVSMILDALLPIKLSILVIIINIPFLLFSLKKIGRLFLVKAAVAMAVFSVFLVIFKDMPDVTEDGLLATVFGGVVLGIGVGMVLRSGGCLDGTEIVAILVSKKSSLSVGNVILGINVVIYLVAGALFGVDRGLYSMLMYFITSKIIDMVETGFDQAKAVMIISEDGEHIANEIYRHFGRTCTFMRGSGLVTGTEKDILYCVVTRAEIYDLTKMIKEEDINAFTTVTDVSEIIGTHIKKIDKKVSDR